ncbi:MAG: D-aminoacyl-tRNA deacylase [Acidimicrobiia bacterium]|nr:D-aminoacyl-tRNA deacylase [Acidimicrobiia bacterium]
MLVVVQRVAQASVSVAGETVADIDHGLLVLVGVAPSDAPTEVEAVADKLVGLRIFADDAGKMNLSVADVGGSVLVVSQFTLLGNVGKGRRPSFTGAAAPEVAEPLVEQLVDSIEQRGVPTASGRFGANMAVSLVNDGPVTLVLSAKDGVIEQFP